MRAKARLVARCFSQRESVDYLETFSSCPCVPSIRLLTVIARELELDLCHFDAEQAFVQSKLDEDVYLRMRQGCGALSGKVVELGRSLYGLKLVVGLWLEDFDPTEPDVDEPFRSLVGHLIRLPNQTHPDILNAVRAVARYSHAPKLVHWKAALHVLMYVRFTSSYGITFQWGTASGVGLEVFVDSDFASRATDRTSISGGVVMCAGACVSFFSRTQKRVTLSSTGAEYVAMAEGFKEAIFLRYIWSFIFPDRDVGCTTIVEDNVGALHLANNPATTPNSKHIDIRHHFLRKRVANGEFRVVHVRSDLQHADFLTKLLHSEAFCVHRNFVMNIS